jgi:hypothetical protein
LAASWVGHRPTYVITSGLRHELRACARSRSPTRLRTLWASPFAETVRQISRHECGGPGSVRRCWRFQGAGERRRISIATVWRQIYRLTTGPSDAHDLNVVGDHPSGKTAAGQPPAVVLSVVAISSSTEFLCYVVRKGRTRFLVHLPASPTCLAREFDGTT